ncbi:hypothetical protein [Pseudomonas mucidolens]|uniref:Uncharacterized protein n=1 Tax=Pseudomonas mucidolens TaxID=46679 RepID=A0A1H2NPK2_9PSED|nr:hypothetical protein [Pseudomonas mucidolens]SDV07330.1 hypothetical protein SAMN05216202_4311 [Pseudomonas mucidolens]SQH31383.1 Uncharacterised protein [Pseudomonas mucidolens]
MDISTAQSIKLAIVSASGLSKDALHIYVGMAVYLTLITITRRHKPYMGWLGVFIIACAAEWVDSRDDIESFGYWRWQASAHDMLNTLFWPTVLTLLWLLKCRNKASERP